MYLVVFILSILTSYLFRSKFCAFLLQYLQVYYAHTGLFHTHIHYRDITIFGFFSGKKYILIIISVKNKCRAIDSRVMRLVEKLQQKQ